MNNILTHNLKSIGVLKYNQPFLTTANVKRKTLLSGDKPLLLLKMEHCLFVYDCA